MANNALAPNIDNVLSDYVYAGRKLKEQRTNNMLNPQVQAALNYLKSVGGKFTSLDTPQDMSLGETAADIGLGFVPGIGTAQGARDFERARRENDYLGMGLSAASMLPVAGGLIKLGKEAAKEGKLLYHASKVSDISEFHPWSHFGTEKAAKSRANTVNATTLYPVKVNVNNPLRVKDIGTTESGAWTPTNLINAIKDKDVDWSKWSGGKKGLIEDASIDDDLGVVQEFLQRNGYDGLVYKNEIEDIGSDSYVAFDPRQVSIYSTPKKITK